MHTCISIIQFSMLISSDRKLRRGDEVKKEALAHLLRGEANSLATIYEGLVAA